MRKHIDADSQLPDSGGRLIDLYVIETAGLQRERQAHASDPAADDCNLHFAFRANPQVAGAVRLNTIVVAGRREYALCAPIIVTSMTTHPRLSYFLWKL